MKFENRFSEMINRLLERPRLAGILVFLFLLLLIGFITNQKYQIVKENERQEMLGILNVVKQNIDQSLKNSYTSAFLLALTLDEQGNPVDFEKVGAELLASNSMLQAVELVPDGVIKYVYPLKGNEKVLGMNVFKEPRAVAIGAYKTVNYKKMYFSGPIKLKQGGTGIIGRIPLFIDHKFWGFSAVVIKLDAFLQQAGLYNNANKKFYFQFSKRDAATGKEEFFLSGEKNFSKNAYEHVFFPDGDWKLYLVVKSRYALFAQLLFTLLLGLAFALVCGVLTMKVFKKPAEIKELADQQARASEQRMGSLIDTIDGIVWEADPVDFHFTFISRKTEEILGYTSEEWLNSHSFWADHVHPDDKDWVVNYCDVCTKALQAHDFEYRMIAKDGTVVWLRDIVNVIAENQQPVLLRGIMINITKQKKAEKTLNDSFSLVNEQNRRLLNFSYIVSHNLRSHTSNIEAISNLMELANSDMERTELLDLLKRASSSLNETLLNLNQVVNIHTSINIKVEALNMKQYIAKTLRALHAEIAAKNVQILESETCDMVVNYNPAYLESILLNFIFNAVRYSHAERKPVVELSCYLENEQQVLQITDNGVGIDMEKYGDELFGMYKTFNGNADSRGIGLFISKNQIDAMGGKVTVSSVVGEGTTFKIYFK